ncbi:MAG: PQQ-dependent sugar dehydrogenase [Patescibacteria group bacterium]
MNKQITVAATIIIAIAVLGGAFAYYFLKDNTSVLSGPLTNDQLDENNLNNTNAATNTATNAARDSGSEGSPADLVTLVPLELTVPEQYATGVFAQNRMLNAPAGFTVSVFAAGLQEPRFMAFDNEGNLIVADKGAGALYVLPDENGDGAADGKIQIDSGLRVMHSVFYYKGNLYAAEEHQVSVYRSFRPDGTYTTKEIVVPGLPSDGGHSTRTVVVGPDEKMYVSIGSSCNLCEETDGRRAAIMRYDLDGSNGEVFASGLRNSVGIEFYDGDLWAVDNGRDRIGDDIPPEEVNVIAKGGHYGWPYCYGDRIVNPEYAGAREAFCTDETVPPAYSMQAHSAPLGMEFMASEAENSGNFPHNLAGNLFIGFHGSWNRTVPTGYKVVRIDTNSAGSGTINFVTGWLQEDGNAWGRPVDVEFSPDGTLYISDDEAGAIYRVVYKS